MKIGNKYLVNEGKVRRAESNCYLKGTETTDECILEWYIKLGGLVQEIEVEKKVKKEEKNEKVSEEKAS